MTTVRIKITGIDKALKAMDPKRYEKAMNTAMHGACDIVRDDLKEYPGPPKRGGWVKKMTPKQRGWYFAALRRGEITVPYRRTGTLGKSWTKRVRRIPSGVKGIVGTNVKYARYVQNRPDQAAIHKRRWRTIQQTAKRKRHEVGRLFNATIKKAMRA